MNKGKPDLFIIQYCDCITIFQLRSLHNSMQSRNGFVKSDSLSVYINTNLRSVLMFSLDVPIQDVPR